MNTFDAYNNILNMRDVCFPHFDSDQTTAGEEILSLISNIPFDVLWDLGCGTGEIVTMAAKRWGDRTFFGIDRSRISLKNARARAVDTGNLHFVCGGIGRIITRPSHGVLCVGNTLIHFGARRFREWLRTLKEPPQFFLIDFIEDWDDVVSRKESFQVKAQAYHNNSTVMTALNTVVLGRRVIRQLLHITTFANKDPKIASATMFQYADRVDGYETILSDMGYVASGHITYGHSYGRMKARLWQL